MAVGHLAAVAGGPVWRPVADADRSWLTRQPLPGAGRPVAELLHDVRDRILPYPMGNGHPRFFGWVNSPPSPAGVLVAPLAAAMNPSCAGGDHAGVLLERTAVRWLAELVGFPHPPGAGLLTSGASMATVIALAAARQRAIRQQGHSVRETGLYGQPPLAVYLSAEGHSCLRKAAELLGMGSHYLRTVPVDGAYRMDTGALRRLIASDREAGVRPMLIAASAGTVNTGAVDPLEEIAGIAREHELWFHVDGAYGALGVLDEGIRPVYVGLERADSLALDPHKWLGVPVDAGCVLFRDPVGPRDTFSLIPPYLRDDEADDLGWFSEYGPEQTRPFRALRVWATIAHLGRDGIAHLVQRTAQLARALADMIEASDDFDLIAPAVTSVVAFRHRPKALDPDTTEALNQAIPTAVQRRGRAFLTGTRLSGTAALRACVLHPDTTEADLTVLLDEIRTAAREITA
ncbi:MULTISPECIES: pyridoxal-dependent decarboxylase [unclassified Streptomyces]|uniref:pyridoxal phosphate-dependent decarboxylase family protein n=1 Tax=unclassified Streptomyces TaxID=2593676 RepID=UPI0023667344|nr:MULTISPECIES: pyridoxal-dependent decarboxylase [unclassified Streptomyces]MDF3142848.1 aminotransferase class V-fold PLP-dependent enzyme [Streptomyces sp. T21Q-yed]WDF42369.1 aminotransferase class V-fold PLP-dependent enzyme [Streptomyces sp. T12]